jgi:hypothetical protein
MVQAQAHLRLIHAHSRRQGPPRTRICVRRRRQVSGGRILARTRRHIGGGRRGKWGRGKGDEVSGRWRRRDTDRVQWLFTLQDMQWPYLSYSSDEQR